MSARRVWAVEHDKPPKTTADLLVMMLRSLGSRTMRGGRPEQFRHRCTVQLSPKHADQFVKFVKETIASPEWRVGQTVAGIVSGDPQEMFVLRDGEFVQLVLQDAGYEAPTFDTTVLP